jgi:hypothetical protein
MPAMIASPANMKISVQRATEAFQVVTSLSR